MRALTTALLALILLAGCASSTTPVIDKSPYRVIPPQAVVKPGESIYSIAWQYGLDYQKIAKWNGLAKPYPVKAGQRLALRPTSASSTAAPQPTAVPKVLPAPTKSTPVAQPVPTPAPAPATVVSTRPPSKWNWPAQGNLLARYSPSKGINGIQIGAAPGSPVRSTAAGEVVYVGDGLRGYGNLVIVKHSPSFLSAYAHNRAIQVAEGDAVEPGQQIAQMGDSGADRTMLHFEIRKDGKPVDPLKYLN